VDLDYIEIGTSDFSTIVEKSDLQGISIEPLDFYLENLPSKPGNIKINAAVAEEDGEADIYYVDIQDIKDYDFPEWVKGCNKLFEPHPSVVKFLNERDLEHLYKTKKVRTISWDSLILENNVSSVRLLKIDTEGYDYKIIECLVNSKTQVLPQEIFFESNILTTQENILQSIRSLESIGYVISRQDEENTEMKLENRNDQ